VCVCSGCVLRCASVLCVFCFVCVLCGRACACVHESERQRRMKNFQSCALSSNRLPKRPLKLTLRILIRYMGILGTEEGQTLSAPQPWKGREEEVFFFLLFFLVYTSFSCVYVWIFFCGVAGTDTDADTAPQGLLGRGLFCIFVGLFCVYL